MIVAVCQHENRKRFGKTSAGAQRFRCKDCGKSWTESTDLLDGMRIGLDRAAQIIEMLCEGMSVRAVERLTGTAKHAILEPRIEISYIPQMGVATAFQGQPREPGAIKYSHQILVDLLREAQKLPPRIVGLLVHPKRRNRAAFEAALKTACDCFPEDYNGLQELAESN